MTPELIKRHAAPLPRYTSYPTANHFNANVGAAEFGAYLTGLAPLSRLSLYVHIPYRRALCWYCGCSTKAVARYDRISEYLTLLEDEIESVAALVPRHHTLSHVHWGGGSPDILSPADIERLGELIRERFTVAIDPEFAVEIDPRLLTRDQVASFTAVGFNRISIGVQDFDRKVQAAIGREQSYTATRAAVELFRERGVSSINIDLVYGLPHQSATSIALTIDQVLSLGPDRVATFSYAHLPSRLKHQRLIDQVALPGAVERFEMSQQIAATLQSAGYLQIGIDHFARPDDRLAGGALARNFQGYTTDRADALIGIGASAISHLPQGYAQNAVAVDDYARRLISHGLATARGWRLAADHGRSGSRFRHQEVDVGVCVSADEVLNRFGDAAESVLRQAKTIVADNIDGFVTPIADGFSITQQGRPFERNVCAMFDAYLPSEVTRRRHALSV